MLILVNKMENTKKNFVNKSDAELRAAVERKRTIESLSREELINELKGSNFATQSSTGLNVAPNSRLAALAAPRNKVIQAEFAATPIITFIGMGIGIIFMIFLVTY